MSGEAPEDSITVTGVSQSPTGPRCPGEWFDSRPIVGACSGLAVALLILSLSVLACRRRRRRLDTPYETRAEGQPSGAARGLGTLPGPSGTEMDYEPLAAAPMPTEGSDEGPARQSRATTLESNAAPYNADDGRAPNSLPARRRIPEKPMPYKVHRLTNTKGERPRPENDDAASPQTPSTATHEDATAHADMDGSCDRPTPTAAVYAVVVKNKSK